MKKQPSSPSTVTMVQPLVKPWASSSPGGMCVTTNELQDGAFTEHADPQKLPPRGTQVTKTDKYIWKTFWQKPLHYVEVIWSTSHLKGLLLMARTYDFKWKLLQANSVRKESRPICGAALTAINDTVTQTGQEEGRSAMSSACKNSSAGPPSIFGMAEWQRASGVSCAEIKRERESHV